MKSFIGMNHNGLNSIWFNIEIRKKERYKHSTLLIAKKYISKAFFRGNRIYLKIILNPNYSSSQPFQKRTTDFEEVKMLSVTRLDK